MGKSTRNKPSYEAFEFEIGDDVQHVSAKDDRFDPVRMLVVERRYQECPGGVQLEYVCRRMSLGMPADHLAIFNEVELETYIKRDPEELMKRHWDTAEARAKARQALKKDCEVTAAPEEDEAADD